MKKSALTLSFLALFAFFMASCNNCVECTDCKDPEHEVAETCYDDVDGYYDSKSEWKEDIKKYEDETGCKCK